MSKNQKAPRARPSSEMEADAPVGKAVERAATEKIVSRQARDESDANAERAATLPHRRRREVARLETLDVHQRSYVRTAQSLRLGSGEWRTRRLLPIFPIPY